MGQVLVAPWRLSFRSYARPSTAPHPPCRRSAFADGLREPAEGVLWRTMRRNTRSLKGLDKSAPLPDANRIARTLDRAMVATGGQASRAIRRVVLRRRDAHGHALHGPSFSADWLLRYALGSPDHCLPANYAPASGADGTGLPAYSHCDGDQAMALVAIVNAYDVTHFRASYRAGRRVDFAATAVAANAEAHKYAVANGIMRYIVRDSTGDVVQFLNTPYADLDHDRVDPPTGDPSTDRRAAFGYAVALTAVCSNPYLFVNLPAINRNDVRIWHRACCVDPMMIMRVSSSMITRTYRRPNVQKALIDVTTRAILDPPNGAKTTAARFMTALPSRVRKARTL